VNCFYRTLLSKTRHLPKVRVVTIKQEVAVKSFLKPLKALQAKHGYDGMNIAEQLATMQRCRRDVAKAGRHNGNFRYKEIKNLPFQILIAGLPARNNEEPRAGCLVFLLGTEMLQLERPLGVHGFYTETDNIVELYREHVRALIGPPTSADADLR
jgi:hypothetical protein